MRYTELDLVKSEMGTANHVLGVHDADMNDRVGAAHAGGAVHDFPKIGVLVKHAKLDANSPKAHVEKN